MGKEYTYPSTEQLDRLAKLTPPHMVPTTLPALSVSEGYLSDDICAEIALMGQTVESYKFKTCGASTRQLSMPTPSYLAPILERAAKINELYWGFDINWADSLAWMQTYTRGSEYPWHVDADPGQSRKLTALALLSDPDEYVGGGLEFYIPNQYMVPKQVKGTILVYPSWLMHQVTPVTDGIRRTINLGMWGPPFR